MSLGAGLPDDREMRRIVVVGFMGVLKPSGPVNVTFQETTPSNVQTAFRAVSLQLPKLKPGPYTLHLQLALKGRSPITTSRPIMVVAGS